MSLVKPELLFRGSSVLMFAVVFFACLVGSVAAQAPVNDIIGWPPGMLLLATVLYVGIGSSLDQLWAMEPLLGVFLGSGLPLFRNCLWTPKPVNSKSYHFVPKVPLAIGRQATWVPAENVLPQVRVSALRRAEDVIACVRYQRIPDCPWVVQSSGLVAYPLRDVLKPNPEPAEPEPAEPEGVPAPRPTARDYLHFAAFVHMGKKLHTANSITDRDRQRALKSGAIFDVSSVAEARDVVKANMDPPNTRYYATDFDSSAPTTSMVKVTIEDMVQSYYAVVQQIRRRRHVVRPSREHLAMAHCNGSLWLAILGGALLENGGRLSFYLGDTTSHKYDAAAAAATAAKDAPAAPAALAALADADAKAAKASKAAVKAAKASAVAADAEAMATAAAADAKAADAADAAASAAVAAVAASAAVAAYVVKIAVAAARLDAADPDAAGAAAAYMAMVNGVLAKLKEADLAVGKRASKLDDIVERGDGTTRRSSTYTVLFFGIACNAIVCYFLIVGTSAGIWMSVAMANGLFVGHLPDLHSVWRASNNSKPTIKMKLPGSYPPLTMVSATLHHSAPSPQDDLRPGVLLNLTSIVAAYLGWKFQRQTRDALGFGPFQHAQGWVVYTAIGGSLLMSIMLLIILLGQCCKRSRTSSDSGPSLRSEVIATLFTASAGFLVGCLGLYLHLKHLDKLWYVLDVITFASGVPLGAVEHGAILAVEENTLRLVLMNRWLMGAVASAIGTAAINNTIPTNTTIVANVTCTSVSTAGNVTNSTCTFELPSES